MFFLLLSAFAGPPTPPCTGVHFVESFVEYVPGGAGVTVLGCGTGATYSCTGGFQVLYPGTVLYPGERLTIASGVVPAPGAYTCTVHTHQGGDSVIVVVVGV